jgi:integrase
MKWSGFMMTLTNDKNNELFNEEVKTNFLNTIKEGTKQSYDRILKIAQKTESILGKDLNQFSKNELEAVLYDFEANNRNTIESYARIISSYLHWSVKNGLSAKNILEDYKPDDFHKFLTNEEAYFTEKQLRRYEDGCANYQDAVIIRLLFNGVGGKQLSEIRNLTKDDVNWSKKQLRLVNTLKADDNGMPVKFTERFLTVDDRTLEIIQGAIDQKTYYKRNGQIKQTPTNNIKAETDLAVSNYVVRPSITRTDEGNKPTDKFVAYRRLQVLSETLGVDDLTAKFIQRSGMVYYANQLIQGDVLSLDDLKMVADRFNMKSYHNLKGFLNVENIRETYPTTI